MNRKWWSDWKSKTEEGRAYMLSYKRRWKENNPEKVKEHARRYVVNHKQKIQISNRLWRTKNRLVIACKKKEFRAKFPEIVRDQERKYWIKNRDKKRAKNRRYLETHRDEVNARKREYTAKNSSKHRLNVKEWRSRNPAKCAIYTQKNRAKRHSAPSTPDAAKAIQFIKSGKLFNCFYCGQLCSPTIEHIISLTAGGSHSAHNIVPCCSKCNTTKNSQPVNNFIKKGQLVLL